MTFTVTRQDLAKSIDHTLLSATATTEQIERLCAEARLHGFGAVCIPPTFVRAAGAALRGSDIDVATVVGFPLGYSVTTAKEEETRCAVGDGARAIDMVMNLAAFKSGQLAAVEEDMARVVRAAEGWPVKVILEIGYLVEEEVLRACALAREAGARYVKTSTGFGPGGATPEAVRVMKRAVGDALGIKAAGGIRGWATAVALLEAGATRLGTSSGLAILAEAKGLGAL